MPTIPTFIGRFKIVSQIGKGGMGALYLAWDPTLEREIAIKLLREDNDDLRERFAREARSIARLRHPHVVTVFDVGVHEDQPFIAMEYIKGQTLAEIIGTGTPLTIVRKLQLAEELCDGLAYAHKAGIVHRDIKPANIIVDEADGSLKLLDFGIARVGPGMTQAGMLIGTLSYMSPEQVTGSAVDGRSDIFAVGAVVYELLARRQAFPGGLDTGILHKILHVQPEPLETLCTGLDAEIVEIVTRALEKDPAARYQELTAMRKDLQRVLRRLEATEPAGPESPDDDLTVLIAQPRSPTPTPRTPKGTDREALERRRASQIQAFLDAAGKALDAGDYEVAIAKCEEVLLLDSDSSRAWGLLDRAKAALDERQADAWLDEAQQHLDRGDLETAADLADRGVGLNPAAGRGPTLLRHINEARQEQERQQQRIDICRSALNRARELFDRGLFDDAAAAADQALEIDPAYSAALSVKQQATEALEAAAKRRDIENQRARETINDAHRLVQAGDSGAALALLEGFSPAHPDVTSARDALRSELEARRQADARRRAEELRAETERQARQQRVAAAMERAKAALVRRDFAGALETLRALQKSDPDAADLEPLIADAEAQRSAAEHARQIAIDVRRHLDAASERLAADDLNAAGTLVRRALALDPGHAEAQVLASRVEDGLRAAAERREQEARRQREREQAFADAMGRAESAPTDGAAIAALREALVLDPDHQTARRLLKEREAAVDVERRVAEALARATHASSTEAAITALRQALQIAPAHPEARRLLQEREEALAREHAEARQARERQAAIASAVRSAAKAPSHAMALAALQTALDIDPNHPEARRLFEERDAALKQEQAATRRRQEIDAACLEIETQIANRAFEAAERSISAFEDDPAAKKSMKALRRSLKAARAAADKLAEAPTLLINLPPVPGDMPAGAADSSPAISDARADNASPARARSPLFYISGAAAVVVLLVIGSVLLNRPPAQSPVAPGSPTSTPPASSAARPQTGEGAAEAPPSSAPVSPVREPPAVTEKPVSNLESQVAPLRRLARQQLVAGAHPQALATAMSGLQLAPEDTELQRVVNDLSTSARASAQRARQLAQAAGPAAVASTGFKDAAARQDLAARLGRNRQVEPSLRAYWEAADLFVAAASQAKGGSATLDRTASQPPPTGAAPVAVAPTGNTATTAPGAAAVAGPPAAPPPAATPPPGDRPVPSAASPVAAAPPPAPPRPPVAQGPNEENLIRSTLQAYAQAYSDLDVAAVKRVFPALDATALTQAFAQMRSQRIQLEIDQVSTSGTSATVTCRVRQHFEPRAGRVSDSVVTATFGLQKTGASWVIVQRR